MAGFLLLSTVTVLAIAGVANRHKQSKTAADNVPTITFAEITISPNNAAADESPAIATSTTD